jgi:hypothetical protein
MVWSLSSLLEATIIADKVIAGEGGNDFLNNANFHMKFGKTTPIQQLVS